MQTGPEDRLALIRCYYEAYDDGDRSLIESVLHAEFTFSSPNDDDIDQATCFARCWPNHETIRQFNLLDLCADGGYGLVRYHASTLDGSGFSNVERSSSRTTSFRTSAATSARLFLSRRLQTGERSGRSGDLSRALPTARDPPPLRNRSSPRQRLGGGIRLRGLHDPGDPDGIFPGIVDR